jgi:transposase
MKTKQIAEAFAVSKAWARRVKQRRREHGETTPRKMGGPGVVKVDRARLADLVAEHPDATASELRELLGVECSESAIYMALKALKLTYKKDDPRVRAGPARRRRAACALARSTTRARCATADLHRRDVGQDEHDASSRSCAKG